MDEKLLNNNEATKLNDQLDVKGTDDTVEASNQNTSEGKGILETIENIFSSPEGGFLGFVIALSFGYFVHAFTSNGYGVNMTNSKGNGISVTKGGVSNE